MATIEKNAPTSPVFDECKIHYDRGFDETEKRTTGRGRIGAISFDEADELFRSWLDKNKWPYEALLFDPRIFTFIFEKTSRLISNKPKGKLIPREGADRVAAQINNALLDYQWDVATYGGSMISKWSLMDINTRKYGAAFALCKWRYETDEKGKVLFDGPEMTVLNNRDLAQDLSGTAIENCNWFQVRQYTTFQELEYVNDQKGKPIYKNLKELKRILANPEDTKNGGDGRETNWISRNRSISGLETDPYGKDPAFKTIEIVTEYRRNRWITFSPKHGVILRDIPNPYKNNEIPITMLRYYMIDDDLYGQSEIEPVKGLQKAINALLCQYVDEINQKLYSPIAIAPGVRQHTLQWGKGARWIMNNPMTDFRLVESQSAAAQYFNNTYSVLVSAMMNALGESSLGVSNVQPYQKDKTATEVKALQLQRNARDNYNQIFLAEALKRQFMLWHSMNQELLFSDENKKNYIIRIVGDEAIRYFEDQGLQDEEDDSTNMEFMKSQIDNIAKGGQAPTPEQMKTVSGKIYKYPVNTGTEEEPKYESKYQSESDGNGGRLYIEKDDLKGSYDFVVDVESMSVNSEDQKKEARNMAIQILTSNPAAIQTLASEGIKPKFKELFVTWLEDLGFADARRYFEKIKDTPGAPGMPQMPGAGGNGGMPPELAALAKGMGGAVQGGIPGGSNPNAGGEAPTESPMGAPQPKINTGTMSPENLQQFFNK